MESMRDLFGNRAAPPPSKARTEREQLVQDFLDTLNPSRIQKGLKPLSHARFNQLVAGWGSKSNLYWLWGECSRANNFGALFWHIVNSAKDVPELSGK